MNFHPADDYDTLLKQARALHQYAVSKERQASHQAEVIQDLHRQLSLCDTAALEAERETNQRLTELLEAKEEE